MNEQPFADPANPPTPDLTSRQKLTKQIEELQIQSSRCIAANDAKGAVIVLQKTIVLMQALLIDELQSTQQMFERVDRRVSDLPQAVKALVSTPEPPTAPPVVDGRLPTLTLSAQQAYAFGLVRDTLLAAAKREDEPLLSMGTKLLLDAFSEYNSNFVHLPW